MGVRITHIPTGLSAESRQFRSQDQNKREAFRKLAKRLVAETCKTSEDVQRAQEVVRTYHEPDNRVVDHRTGARDTYDNVIVKCRLDKLQ